jgi:hypothetical protein
MKSNKSTCSLSTANHENKNANTIVNENKNAIKCHMIFQKKQAAIEYICSHGGLKLFSEDITEENGSKRFMATTYDNMYKLSLNKDRNMYENYEAGQAIKLVLDIDFKLKDANKNNEDGNDNEDVKHNNENVVVEGKKKDEVFFSGFGDLLKECITVVNDKLMEYTELKPIVIVLTSCRADKLSAHVIYNNIHFNDVSQMKCFMLSIDSHLINSKIIDPLVYKVSCMRLLWNSKKGKSNILTYYDAPFCLENKYKYVNDYKLFMDCLLTNINKDNSQLITINVPIMKQVKKENKGNKGEKKKTTKNIKHKIDQVFEEQTEDEEEHIEDENSNYNVKYDIPTLKQYVDLLNDTRADDYNFWITVGMCLHNCNNTRACFLLWDTWSQKSDKYSGKDINYWKWNTFHEGALTIGTLIHYAMKDNPESCEHIKNPSVDVRKFDTIKIKEEFLIDTNKTIKDTKSVMCDNIRKWQDSDDVVTLAVISPYGSKKTTMVDKILDEYNPARALFITHRQSLTFELHRIFDKRNFCSYLHKSFRAKRLICQIESLHKIPDPYNIYTLVILDEIESILHHFTSSTIDEKYHTFALMYRIVEKSKKIIALDGDFHNRGFDFLNNFGKQIIIQNTIIKNKRTYIFTDDQVRFNERIDDDLKSGLNVVLISMAAKKCDYYYEKYKDIYDSLCHTGYSDDAMKELLKNVDIEWICRFLVYSSAVHSGISFNRKHFHKMYVILSTKSCTSRDLMQMSHRVREFDTDDVYVYLNGLPYRETANFFTYDIVQENTLAIYKQVTGRTEFSTVEAAYVKNLIHNEVEDANKNMYYFVPKYIEYIKNSGSDYRYDETGIKRKDKSKEVRVDFQKDRIIAAEDIDEKTYKKYVQKNIQKAATSSEKFAIEKYLYKKFWKIDQIDNMFMNLWFRKSYVLMNLRCLVDKKTIEKLKNELITIDPDTNKSYLVYDKAKQKERVDAVKELIEMLGFDIEIIGTNLKIPGIEFEKNMKKSINDCSILNGTDDIKYLFGYENKENLSSIRAFMGFLNSSILKDFGLVLCSKYQTKRINSEKYISTAFYSLEYFENIEQYVA